MLSIGKPTKKDELVKDDRKRLNPPGLQPKPDPGMPRSGPGNRGPPVTQPLMGPSGGYGSHKDIKLMLVNKVFASVLHSSYEL